MKKILVFIPAFLLVLSGAFGQSATTPTSTTTTTTATNSSDVSAPQPQLIGVDKAQQELKEVSIDKFEDDGFWQGSMPRDDGLIRLRRFEASPVEKKPIDGETQAQIKESDKYVLGAKIDHLRRAVTYFEVTPIRPLPIPGITKTISVWVVGRNVKHELFVVVGDRFGGHSKIPLGDLAFTGWKKLTAAIPPSVRQADPHYNNRQGISIEKFIVETDPVETYGSYFIYFDDLRAVTDLFSEDNRDSDDMTDAW